ncbi:ESX-1 secretion-associated protein [Mycobacterium sp. NPDC049093]
MTQLNVSTSAVSAWGEQFNGLSDAIGNVISGAPGTSGIESSHGPVAFPTQSAFSGAYSARGDALGATQVASGMIGDLLRQAAQAYDRGDSEAAGRLRAQADQLAGESSSRSAAVGGSGGGQGGGMQAASQMMGQFSQVASQMIQSATQPVQGIMQGMSQMPQQVMQGVQSIVQTATQAAGGGATADAAAPIPTAATAGGAPTEAAGSHSGERAPVHHEIMSEERMREMQGLPSHGEDRVNGPVTRT